MERQETLWDTEGNDQRNSRLMVGLSFLRVRSTFGDTGHMYTILCKREPSTSAFNFSASCPLRTFWSDLPYLTFMYHHRDLWDTEKLSRNTKQLSGLTPRGFMDYKRAWWKTEIFYGRRNVCSWNNNKLIGMSGSSTEHQATLME